MPFAPHWAAFHLAKVPITRHPRQPHEGGIRCRVPPQSNRNAKVRWSARMYRERNRIERMSGHLKSNRAIATRYDNSA